LSGYGKFPLIRWVRTHTHPSHHKKGLDDTRAQAGVVLPGHCCCRYHDFRRKYSDYGGTEYYTMCCL